MLVFGAVNTLLQVFTPDRLRGRVMAVYSMAFSAAVPLGALLAGALAERFGAPRTLAAGGALCIACALAYARALPRLSAPARELLDAAADG